MTITEKEPLFQTLGKKYHVMSILCLLTVPQHNVVVISMLTASGGEKPSELHLRGLQE